MSFVEFHPSDVTGLTLSVLKMLAVLRIVAMETGIGKIRINNLTLINFVIKCVGPCHERILTLYVMIIQVSCYQHFSENQSTD